MILFAQTSLMTFCSSSSSFQMELNLKGTGPKFSNNPSESATSLWYHAMLWMILDFISLKEVNIMSWIRNVYNLSFILFLPILLLLHVYFPLIGGMYIRLHVSIITSTISLKVSTWNSPTNFSSTFRTRLRSPPIIMFLFWTWKR